MLAFVYESVNKISPPCLFDFFEILSDLHQFVTRQTRKVDVFLVQEKALQYGLRYVRYAGSKSSNKIPFNIKQALSAMNFRYQL